MLAEEVLSCRRLVKIYDTPVGRVDAVRGVDLSLRAGQVVGVIGPSGSGKSSLFRMISGLDVPTAGAVRVAGNEMSVGSARVRAALRRRLVSHLHQRPADNLLAHLTVEQQLRMAAGRGRTVAVAPALADLGLAERAEHFPAELSGGEQQRAAFARTLVRSHPLVLADEPTAELDTASAANVLHAAQRVADQGALVLIATHDPRLIGELDVVILLRNGAVASIEEAGQTLVPIDESGRLQLPKELLARFTSRRGRVRWNPSTGVVEVEPE